MVDTLLYFSELVFQSGALFPDSPLKLEQGGVSGLQRALALYSGAFLPQSELEWVERQRFKLEFDLAELGIEAMKELFALERYEECLRLAERLAEIATLNLGVQLMLLKATSRVHGRVAARARLERVDPLIRADLRGLPEVKLELQAPEPEQLN
jgi:DNA-binding SARP family transcriptional activator